MVVLSPPESPDPAGPDLVEGPDGNGFYAQSAQQAQVGIEAALERQNADGVTLPAAQG